MTIEKNSTPISFLAPFTGRLIPLEDLGDDVFSRKLLGDGIAMEPTAGSICAPVDGVVANVFPTGHAFVILTEQGLGILVHFGLDSTALGGEGFRVCVAPGETVRAGQLLAEADLEQLKARGLRTASVCVICEGGETLPVKPETGLAAAGKDPVMTLG